MRRDEQEAYAERVLRAALADQGLGLESVSYADDDLFPDYEHAIIRCRGEKPVSTVLLDGELDDRELLAAIALRVSHRIADRRAAKERLARITCPGGSARPLPAAHEG